MSRMVLKVMSKLPPLVTVFGHTWMGMVIVVPTFAVGQQSDPPIIAAVIACFIVAIAPHVTGRVDQPGRMQDENHTQGNRPDQPRNCELGSLRTRNLTPTKNSEATTLMGINP
jgi:hypothetical protein